MQQDERPAIGRPLPVHAVAEGWHPASWITLLPLLQAVLLCCLLAGVVTLHTQVDGLNSSLGDEISELTQLRSDLHDQAIEIHRLQRTLRRLGDGLGASATSSDPRASGKVGCGVCVLLCTLPPS